MWEGTHTIYLVQFFTSNGDRWTAVDVGAVLFEGLSYQDRKQGAEKGDSLRALIEPQGECWQQTGVHGFLCVEDAWAAYDACVATGKYNFRVARCSWVKHTDPVTDRGAMA